MLVVEVKVTDMTQGGSLNYSIYIHINNHSEVQAAASYYSCMLHKLYEKKADVATMMTSDLTSCWYYRKRICTDGHKFVLHWHHR